MFRNAIASSSRLPPTTYIPRAILIQSSGFSTSPPAFETPSAANTLNTLFPDGGFKAPDSNPSTSTPPTTPSRSVIPPRTSIPSISSLSSSRLSAAPTFRWDPTPAQDETPTTHTLTVTSTRNNLLLTLSDRQGPVFPTITAGSGKTFKNAARSGYEAGHQASLKMFEKLLEVQRDGPNRGSNGGVRIRLAMKGFGGQGAEAFTQALGGNEGGDVRRLIARVEDRTGVKIGGTRARKPRRL